MFIVTAVNLSFLVLSVANLFSPIGGVIQVFAVIEAVANLLFIVVGTAAIAQEVTELERVEIDSVYSRLVRSEVPGRENCD